MVAVSLEPSALSAWLEALSAGSLPALTHTGCMEKEKSARTGVLYPTLMPVSIMGTTGTGARSVLPTLSTTSLLSASKSWKEYATCLAPALMLPF